MPCNTYFINTPLAYTALLRRLPRNPSGRSYFLVEEPPFVLNVGKFSLLLLKVSDFAEKRAARIDH